jgi:dihydroorotase
MMLSEVGSNVKAPDTQLFVIDANGKKQKEILPSGEEISVGMPNTAPPVITGPRTVDYRGTITLTADKAVNFTTDSNYITLEKVDEKTVKVTSTKNFIKTGSAEIKATPVNGGDAVTVTVKVKPTFWQWLMIIFLFGWIWM